MVSIEEVRRLALSFPEAQELPHFEKASFRVKKRIFVTLDEKQQRICLKLSETDQSAFCSFNKEAVYPVPNKWGKQGWTFAELKLIPEEMLHDALDCAYREVAKKQK